MCLQIQAWTPELAMQDAPHPMAIKHPLSGRPCIYVNLDITTHLEGWHDKGNETVLAMLYKAEWREERTWRPRWLRYLG